MRKIRFIRKKQCRRFTFWGWLLFLMLISFLVWIFIRSVVPFLTAENPVACKVMVVEGYVSDDALLDIREIFEAGNYDLLITTGPHYDQGYFITGVKSAAELIGRSLIRLGFDSTKLSIVPIPRRIFRDRTYNSALVTRQYLKTNHPDVKKINLVSQSVHARRSHYLYRMAYEPEYVVGNVVIQNENIQPGNWYKSSRGFRTVIDETIAYLYVVLFFFPDQP